MSESDDEEEYEEGVEEGIPPQQNSNDVETGSPSRRARDPSKPRQDEIIPVYRRDCHEEVCFFLESLAGDKSISSRSTPVATLIPAVVFTC